MHPDFANKLRLNHVLNSLSFGDIPSQQNILKIFGQFPGRTSFDMMPYVPDALYNDDSEAKDYFYFLKLVPHIFVDETSRRDYHSYSYSLNHNAKVILLIFNIVFSKPKLNHYLILL
jgi:hypothetical protein